MMNVLRFVAGIAIRRELCARSRGQLVTVVATRRSVFAGQWIVGVTSVVKGHALPSKCRVATFTTRRKAAAMGIILCMTTDAGLRRSLEGLAGVALLASNNDVQSSQRESAEAVIELHVLFPRGDPVAILAGGTKLTLVDILGAVTTDASGGQLCTHVSAVTVTALCGDVRTFQREFGLFVMIKLCFLPRLDAVAVLAIRSQALVMDVLNGMATHTGGAEVFIDFSDVARDAGCFDVTSAQGKRGLLVVVSS